ncbi:MAG: hypothetical protein CSA31_00665 [Desulfobulbus propionicus]|nr:MAG: hypothetical protein CSA31_00665 [Desulfobulbus propionicus]
MKTRYITCAALLFSFVFSGAAIAEVLLSGDVRIRYHSLASYGFGAPDIALTRWDSRSRLQISGTTRSGIYAVGRVRLTGTAWNGEPDVTNYENVHVDRALLGIPFSDSASLEIGRVNDTITDFLFEDIHFSGARAFSKLDDLTVKLLYAYSSEGKSSDNEYDVNEDDDTQTFALCAEYALSDKTTVGAAWLQFIDDDNSGSEDGYRASVFGDVDAGNFSFSAELAVTDPGESSKEEDNGTGGFFQVNYAMKGLNLALQCGFTQHGFVPDVDWGYFILGGDEPTTAFNIGENGDWIWAGLQSNYAVSENLKMTGNIVYAHIDVPADGIDSLGKGVEVSGRFAYTLNERAQFSWTLGYLQPEFEGQIENYTEEEPALGFYAEIDIQF